MAKKGAEQHILELEEAAELFMRMDPFRDDGAKIAPIGGQSLLSALPSSLHITKGVIEGNSLEPAFISKESFLNALVLSFILRMSA